MTGRLAQPKLWLALGLAAGAALRLWVATHDDGIYWPDEIYQSLEPAHRLVFGHGLVAWEFIEGARNWALPGFVALLLGLSKTAGFDQPAQYLLLVRLAFIALSLGCGFVIFRAAKDFGAHEHAAALAGAAFALASPVFYFSHRAMSENACALPALAGLWLTLAPAPPDSKAALRRHLLGASLLGIAVLLRLQCGLFAAGACVALLARKDFKAARNVFGVLCVWAVAFGALDAFTWSSAPGAKWGGWFHSAFKYLQFNLVEGRASQWGTAPFSFYASTLLSSMPGVTLLLAVFSLLAARKVPALFALAAVFFFAHSAIAHKELRFLVPLLPLLFVLAAVGASQLSEARRPIALVALLLASGYSAVSFRSLTFGDLGAYPERPQSSAWDDFGAVNRLMLAAAKREDLCGLRIDVAHLAWTGGFSYLHRKAPLYMPGTAPNGHFNYLIAPQGTAQRNGLQPVATEANLELLSLPMPCTYDDGYSWRLP